MRRTRLALPGALLLLLGGCAWQERTAADPPVAAPVTTAGPTASDTPTPTPGPVPSTDAPSPEPSRSPRPTEPPATRQATEPPRKAPFDGARLTTAGYGPITWQTPESVITENGWGQSSPTECLTTYSATGALKDAGITAVAVNRGKVVLVSTFNATVQTGAGVQVGMTVEQMRSRLGAEVQKVGPEDWGIQASDGSSIRYRMSNGRVQVIAASSQSLKQQMAPCTP